MSDYPTLIWTVHYWADIADIGVRQIQVLAKDEKEALVIGENEFSKGNHPKGVDVVKFEHKDGAVTTTYIKSFEQET